MHSMIIITATITTRESQYHNTTISTTPHEQELKKKGKEWEKQSNKTEKRKTMRKKNRE